MALDAELYNARNNAMSEEVGVEAKQPLTGSRPADVTMSPLDIGSNCDLHAYPVSHSFGIDDFLGTF